MKRLLVNIYVAMLAFLTAFCPLWGATSPGGAMQFRHLNTENSRLSHNFITSVVQDSLGFVWIGTTNGLNRFDGRNVRAYYHGELNLPSSAILDMALDSRGKIWVHTDAGDAVYDRNMDEFIKEETDVFRTKERVYQERLSYLMGELGFAERLKDTSPRTVAVDSEGRMWLGTSHGIWIYDSSASDVLHIEVDPDNPYSLSDDRVNSIFTGASGEVWIATETGLDFSDSFCSKFRKYTSLDGISLKSSYVNGFANDGNGSLWISSERAGLFRYSTRSGDFKRCSFPSIRRKIMGVRWLSSRLWILSEDGFQILSPRSGAFCDYVLDSAGDRIGAVRDICDGEPYCEAFVATKRGVFSFRDGCLSKIDEIGDIFVEDINVTEDGEVWLSTYSDGVIRYYPSEGRIRKFSHSDSVPGSIPENRVVVSFEGRDKSLWFCTFGSGVARLNPSDSSFIIYNSRTLGRNFINDLCVSLAQDSRGNLWIGTERGILRFNPPDRTVVAFSRNEGLLNDVNSQYNLYISPGDDIFVGSADGLTVFNANAVCADAPLPRIVVSDFYIDGKRVGVSSDGSSPLKRNIDLTDEIFLPPSQNSLRFDIARINSRQGGGNAEWKLAGYTTGWSLLGEDGSIVLTNLPPGDYTLQLRPVSFFASGEIQKSIAVHVATPFYASWWAILLYILASAALIASAWILIRKRVLRRERERQEILRQGEEKKLLRDKMTFVSTAVSEIKTPLLLIKSPLDNIKRSHPEDGEMLSDVSLIDSTMSYLAALSGELLHYINSERYRYLLDKQKILQQRMDTGGKALKDVLNVDGESPLSPADRDFLRRVDEVILRNCPDAAFNVENLKDELNMSKSSLLRKFNRLLGTSPNNYIRTKRLQMAARLFDEGADRVSDVCYSCGFNSTSYFAKCFLAHYGMSPVDYMKKRTANRESEI